MANTGGKDHIETSDLRPVVYLDLPAIPGDVPAGGPLIITDASSQSRRTVEWGLEIRPQPATHAPASRLDRAP